MGLEFKDLVKAQELFHKHGMKAEDFISEINRLWKANDMDAKMQKAQIDLLLLYGTAKFDLTNIKE